MSEEIGIDIEENTSEFMDTIGRSIDILLNKESKKYGFFLTVFKFNDSDGVGNYVSNCERKEMVKGIEEVLEILKNQEDINTGERNGSKSN